MSQRVATSCPVCHADVESRDLARHLRDAHSDQPAVARGRSVSVDSTGRTRSRSSSRGTLHSSAASTRKFPDSSSAAESDLAGRFVAAARGLLRQHQSYTEAGLDRYLAENHPYVPPDQRRALIFGATTGACEAARKYFLAEKNKMSFDKAKRVVAANAESALSFWNDGLGDEDVCVPYPTLPPKSPEAVAEETGELATQLVQTPLPMDLDDVQFPVSMEVAQREYENALADIAESEAACSRPSPPGEPTVETVAPASAPSEQRTDDRASPAVSVTAPATEMFMSQGPAPVSSTPVEEPTRGLAPQKHGFEVRETDVPPYVPLSVTSSAPTGTYDPTPISSLAREGLSQPRHRITSSSGGAPAASPAAMSKPPLSVGTEGERNRSAKPPSEKHRNREHASQHRSPRPDGYRSPRRPKTPTRRVTLSVRRYKEFERFCTRDSAH